MKEDKLFVWLVVVISLALLVSIFMVVTLSHTKASFSSAAFLNPDNLPNLVKTNSEQSVSYEISSFEDDDTEYVVQSNVELYRLYDTSEGLHRCLSPYRKKYFVAWTNSTELQYVQTPKENIVQDLHITQDIDPLVWSEVNLYFSLGKLFGQGEFVIYYGKINASPDYVIRIDTRDGNIYLNETYMNKINVSKENDNGRISYKDGYLNFVYEDELLFREAIDSDSGQFGFESRNGLFLLNKMIVSQYFPIEIPDRGNVINYQFSDEFFYNELSRIRNNIAKSYNFIRQYTTRDEITYVPRVCNDFDCTYTQSTDQALLLENRTNITPYILDLPWNNITLPFWHVARDDIEIPWTALNITGDRPILPRDASISLFFDEHLVFTITNKSISALYTEYNNIRIRQYPLNETTFQIEINNKRVTMQTDHGPVSFDIPFEVYNDTVRLFTINSLSTVSRVDIQRLGCEPLTFCRLTLLPSVPRRFTNQETISNVGERVEYIPRIPLRRTSVQNDSEEELVVSEQFINTIPDVLTSFNGAQAIIKNSSNFSFSLRTKYLDGKGLISLYFKDLNDTVLFNVTHDLANALLYVDGEEITLDATPLTWRRIQIGYLENISVSFNGTEFYSGEHWGPADGYFAIETYDSHLEFTNLRLQRDNFARNLPLLEDPCRLRLVYSEVLRNEEFTLEPENSKNFLDTYTLNNFFDYGKVNVDLYGSSNTNDTALHIHHWLVRE